MKWFRKIKLLFFTYFEGDAEEEEEEFEIEHGDVERANINGIIFVQCQCNKKGVCTLYIFLQMVETMEMLIEKQIWKQRTTVMVFSVQYK